MEFNGNQTVQGPKDSFSALFRLIRALFIVWNRLKPFEQFALKLSFGP